MSGFTVHADGASGLHRTSFEVLGFISGLGDFEFMVSNKSVLRGGSGYFLDSYTAAVLKAKPPQMEPQRP